MTGQECRLGTEQPPAWPRRTHGVSLACAWRVHLFSCYLPVILRPIFSPQPFLPPGCIKLRLVHAGVGLRQVFLLLSGDQSNPAGLAAGSRGSFQGSRGNDPRTRGLEILASWRDARTARSLVKPGPVRVRSKTGWQQLWHPFWVQETTCAFTRWSAPSPWPTTGCQPCRVGFRK